eukprot:gnl/MRDRNA2_/MRDRNA2_102465_c0_seq1.p1 gnl/MRDRNA2_/MRDRNA2_102465_c0~~gnl/MRDRNA2_/MRDRNA2_102465_c0_seq1.p1  ORF type:complete len:123 (+),score=24.23 gnl/MRDRNA2_/MRDRNA2_102465_c0_seq1:78-446(+)
MGASESQCYSVASASQSKVLTIGDKSFYFEDGLPNGVSSLEDTLKLPKFQSGALRTSSSRHSSKVTESTLDSNQGKRHASKKTRVVFDSLSELKLSSANGSKDSLGSVSTTDTSSSAGESSI